jgi:hypothetical protein
MSEEATLREDIDYAKFILSHNQNLINLIDAKAGVLIAVDGAILAILSTSRGTVGTDVEQLVLGSALLLFGISAFFGFLIIMPRIHKTHPNTKIFYTAILSQTRQQYKESFTATPEEVLDDYLNNIYTLALIQERKFLYLRNSLYSLLVGLVPMVAILVVVH